MTHARDMTRHATRERRGRALEVELDWGAGGRPALAPRWRAVAKVRAPGPFYMNARTKRRKSPGRPLVVVAAYVVYATLQLSVSPLTQHTR